MRNNFDPSSLNSFFSNITTWGPSARSVIFSDEYKEKYQVIGVVETHTTTESNADFIAQANGQGFSIESNVAMKYGDSLGNHGGEAILASKFTYSIPIDAEILEASSSINDECRRFSVMEVRFGQMSILCFTAYFWCSEGLSARNWVICQQISHVLWQFELPFILFADFNMSPDTFEASGWLGLHSSSLLVPDVDTTCKGSKHILDFCVVSTCLRSFFSIEPATVPWGPHIGLKVSLHMYPSLTMVKSLVEPLPLPMRKFHEKWKNLGDQHKKAHMRRAMCQAHQMLSQHSMTNSAPAILGAPMQELVSDYKFQPYEEHHIHSGEVLAQAALQTELLVCAVAGVRHTHYIGRSQYPKIVNKPSRSKHATDDKFTCPAANLWGTLSHVLETYICNRAKLVAAGEIYVDEQGGIKNTVVPTEGQCASALKEGKKSWYAKLSPFTEAYQRRLAPFVIKASKLSGRTMCQGSACTAEELKSYYDDNQKINDDWKGEQPNVLVTSNRLVSEVLLDLHNTSDLVLLEFCSLAKEYKDKALRVKGSKSAKSWRDFCLAQLSKNVGARVLHKYTNRHSLVQPVPLFKPGGVAKTPNQAVEVDAQHWKTFWQRAPDDWTAHTVIEQLRQECMAGLSLDSKRDFLDMSEFSSKLLFESAKTYSKVSKGSDNWLASEILLPDEVLQPIAHAIDMSVCTLAWPHQMLLVLNPELRKAVGFRTIAKTPKLYRLWARTRREPIALWEKGLEKPYDSACKGSSALLVASHRALFAEIAHRNGDKVCGTFFDMEKFFDTIAPGPLLDSLRETSFPPIDALMGFQMHVAPRVILVSTVPSEPIRIDASILAGCIYSVPWVKGLLHPGSSVIHAQHPEFATYVDDVSNVVSGYGPDVEDSIIKCALAFSKLIVVKRKFRLSNKSAIVANDKKLAYRISRELAQSGIVVQVSHSTRDVGVMFTAGTHRDTSNSLKRLDKAKKRTARIIRIASVTRAARKLYTSGAYPQGTWGHQCLGTSGTQMLVLRRMAAASTGVSSRAQRCLTSCIFVCYGRRGDPWQRILKENISMWLQLMPCFYQKSHMDLALAWSRAKQQVVRGPTPVTVQEYDNLVINWKMVTGPMSSMVASLYAIGWNPATFSAWFQPDGTSWSIPIQKGFQFCSAPLIHAAQDQVSALLWKSSSSHINGRGLHDGIAYGYTMNLLNKFRKEQIYDKAAALETIMCAACWPPQRKYDHGMITSGENVCHHCQVSGCDDFHQFWECPSLESSVWPEISNTQHLIPAARAGVADYPCLWVRGLLPAGLCRDNEPPIPPPPSVEKVFIYDPRNETPDHLQWPQGLYGTDASGGAWGSFNELRRCGVGVSRVATLDPPFSVRWAAHCPLIGEVQTVPRAELFAIYLVVSRVTHGRLFIVSDSKVNVDLFRNGRSSCMGSINFDLWIKIYQHLDNKNIHLSIFWVPGHLDTNVAKVKSAVPDAHFALNYIADKFAEKAAHLVQLPTHITSSVVYYTRLVARIQKRFVRILITNFEKSKYEKRVPVPRIPHPTLCEMIDATTHNLHIEKKHFRCLDCGGSCSQSSVNVANWLRAKCTPLPFDDSDNWVYIPKFHVVQIANNIPHATHSLCSFRGIVFCSKCGAHSTKKCRLLNSECTRHTTAFTSRALAKLKSGQLPTSLVRWPRPPNRGVMAPPSDNLHSLALETGWRVSESAR